MALVRIQKKELQAEVGRSLLQVAEEAGIRVPGSCAGHGKCGECVIVVDSGTEALSPRTDAESHLEMVSVSPARPILPTQTPRSWFPHWLEKASRKSSPLPAITSSISSRPWFGMAIESC